MTAHRSPLELVRPTEPGESDRRDSSSGRLAVSRLDLDRLVALAGSAEPRATEEVLRQLRPMLLRYCRARLGREAGTFEQADDLAQEACVAVLAALPGYRTGTKPFTALAFDITARKVDGYRRRAARTADPTAAIPDRQPAQHCSDADRARALFDQLPDDLCHLLVLRVAVGLSANETSRAVGTSADAVRVAQHRALTRFRALVRNVA